MNSLRLSSLCIGVALSITACQVSPPATPRAEVAFPTLSLDAGMLVDNLASKPNRNWQDPMLTFPPLVRKLRDQKAGYRLQAPAGNLAWSYDMGAASSVVPVFMRKELYYDGPAAQTGDKLFTMTNGGMMRVFDPTAPTPVPIATGTGLGSYNNTALALSGDNKRIYALTTDGNFKIIDPVTLTAVYTKKISNAGFLNTAPYIDYGNNPSGGNTNFGSIENVFAVSRDGSVFRLYVDQSTGTLSVSTRAWLRSGGNDVGLPASTWDVSSTTGYAVANPTVEGFPIAWKNRVWFGTTAGYLLDLDATTGITRSYNLAGFTTATGNGRNITAPPALAFDAGFNADKVFAACGDRVDWIDLATGAVTASPSLTLDRDPGPNYGTLASVTPLATRTFTAFTTTDFASIKTGSVPVPSMWGGTAGASAVGTGLAAISVRIASNGDAWVTDNANDRVRCYRTNGTIVNVPTNNAPIKLEFDNPDGSGDLWVAGDGIANGTNGWVTKINPATGTQYPGFPKAIGGAVWLAPDGAGNCYVSSYHNDRVHKLNGAGNSVGGAWPITVSGPGGAGPGTIFTDPVTKNLWAFPYGTDQIRIHTPAGAAIAGSPFDVSTNNTALAFSVIFKTSGSPRIAYATLNNTNEILKMNADTGAIISRATTAAASPATLRFDNAGNVWSTNTQVFGTTPRTVQIINPDTGANLSSAYSMTAFGNPYEIVFDASDTGWVACSDPNFTTGALVNISNLGETRDIFGTQYRALAGDGDDSYGFMKFKIANNALSSYVPYAATLRLTAALAATGENVEAYGASVYNNGGVAWTGYPGTPNIANGNRPAVYGAPSSTYSIASINLGATFDFDVPPPADQANTPGDTANHHAAYAVRTTNKQLRNAIHWYSNNSNGGVAARNPQLIVKGVDNVKLPTSNGIRMQPAVDDVAQRVYVGGTNAMFELSYASDTAWRSRASTSYALTAAGRAGITTTSSGGGTYVWPQGSTLITEDGRVVVPDYNPSSPNAVVLNAYDLNLSGDRHSRELDLNPGRGTLTTQLLYDYAGGHVYTITSNNRLIRAAVLQ